MIEPVQNSKRACFGVFKVDLQAEEIRKHGVLLRLANQPFQILSMLLERPGEIVTREELRLRLWPGNYYTDFDHGLNKGINRLREVLSDDRVSPRFIETVPQRGYRFIAPVTWEPTAETNGGTSGAPVETAVLPASPRESAIILKIRKAFPPIFASLVLGVAIGGMWATVARKTSMPHPLRAQFILPSAARLVTEGNIAGGLVLSPDEATLAFTARTSSGQVMLWREKLSDATAEPIPGTEDAQFPFWSPDSKSVGFFTINKLKRLDIATKAVRDLCDADSPRGGSWGPRNVIIFAASNFGGIWSISADGGRPVAITSTESSRFTTQRWPSFLPDGKRFLFTAANHDPKKSVRSEILVASLGNAAPRHVVYADANPQYVDGKLLYIVGHSLFAQDFNLKSATVERSPSLISDTVENNGTAWHATFSATGNLLVFQEQSPAASSKTRVEWRDQSGKLLDATEFGSFHGIAIQSAKAFLVETGDPDDEISLMDRGKRLIQLTNAPVSSTPLPSPDGTTVAFYTHRGSQTNIHLLKINASEDYEAFPSTGAGPMSWSPDGNRLLYSLLPGEMKWFDFRTKSSTPYFSSSAFISGARFSPDGNWVAYANDETGQMELYVASFPNPSKRYRVSRAGGGVPRWSNDGQALHFMTADGTIYRANVEERSGGLIIAEPHALFSTTADLRTWSVPAYDVDPAGHTFVVVARAPDAQPKIAVLTNWRVP